MNILCAKINAEPKHSLNTKPEMHIQNLIAEHVLAVHEGNNWTEVDLTNTLKDVTLAEATTQTKASPNTIAALLHHLSYWNRVMVQRINNMNVAVPDANGFDVQILQNEQDWYLLKKDNLKSAHELAEAIQNFDENQLPQPILKGYPSAYKSLHGSVEHIHYHLGQIVILKNLIRADKNSNSYL